jgi:hypothetical protein
VLDVHTAALYIIYILYIHLYVSVCIDRHTRVEYIELGRRRASSVEIDRCISLSCTAGSVYLYVLYMVCMDDVVL